MALLGSRPTTTGERVSCGGLKAAQEWAANDEGGLATCLVDMSDAESWGFEVVQTRRATRLWVRDSGRSMS